MSRVEGRICSDSFSWRPAPNLKTTLLTAVPADHPRSVGERLTNVPAPKNGSWRRVAELAASPAFDIWSARSAFRFPAKHQTMARAPEAKFQNQWMQGRISGKRRATRNE
jgi:hypothetical protein